MSEQNYAFIKNQKVVNVVIFDNPSFELLETFKNENELDEIILANDKTAVDGTYDGFKFWLPQPYPSWTKNEELNEWQAPVPYPIPENEGVAYIWNEEALSWEKITPIE